MTEQMTGKMTEQMTDKERNEVETNQDASGQAVEAPKKKMSTVRLAKMGMLVAISVVLVYFIHFPIIPAIPFMEYDPSEIPILLGTFAFGPVAGIILTIITAVVQGTTVSAASGIYGILMHIVATGTLIVVAGCIYRHKKTRKNAVLALAIGVLAMVVVMGGANMIVTPFFMGVPASAVWALMPAILAFNLIKGVINSLVTFLCYKRLSGFLHKQ